MPRRYQRLISMIMALSFLLTGAISVAAYHEDDTTIHPWADDRFEDRWERTDRPVAEGEVARTWIWGPSPFTEGMMEPYLEAPGGMRLVQYMDKSRMELLDPEDDDTSLWTVTQGLLALDMMLGRVQVGDAAFASHSEGPSTGNVAGDPGPNNGPTYAAMGGLIDTEARAEGTVITERVSVDGQVTDDPSLASYNVTAAERVTQDWVDHTVASVFWDFMNSEGIIWDDDDDEFETDDLFMNPFYAVGLPTTEAYWTTVNVDREEMDVLVQCFERRCLTYAPENPTGWMVEAGNVGQHYYRWLETHVGPLVPVIASELDQPRHLLSTDHGLYIAEAGLGGDVCHEFEEEFEGEIEVFELCIGPSSAITRIHDGEQTRVVEGLPSIWTGEDATGAHDITFDDDDNMYIVIGMGGSPEMRDVFGEAGELLATVVRVEDDGSVTLLADLAEYEAMENPDPALLDTNPYAIDFDGEDLIVVDAGGNSLLRVDPDTGDIETIATFPSRMVPAPPFIPADEIPMEAVPSDVVVGPDGNYYVSELTGFPFPIGEARVYQVTPDGDVSEYADGFTNIGSIDFDSDGRLVVLELIAGGLLNVDFEAIEMGDFSSAAGRLIRVESGGSHTILDVPGLTMATGLSIGEHDEMYIAHWSITPMAEVIRIDQPDEAAQLSFSAEMSGNQEVPPVTTSAAGSATFTVSHDRSSIAYQVNVSNLDDVTMAHIHLAPVGVNGGVVVWLYPDAPPPVEIPGTTTGTLATGTIVEADLVGDLAGQSLEDLISEMEAGNTYVNVHTTEHPAGEIRGQIGADHIH